VSEGHLESSPSRSQGLEPHRDALRRLGLNPETVEMHAGLIRQALRDGRKPQFAVVDTCRIDNGGLLPAADALLPLLANGDAQAAPADAGTGYVAFVPAAGAASRYAQPLAAAVTALENDDEAQLAAALAALRAAGAAEWPLPDGLRALLVATEGALPVHLDDVARRALHSDLLQAKALMPCVMEGDTFLALKHLEHRKIAGLAGEVFVAPAGATPAFERELERVAASRRRRKEDARFDSRILEQGPMLSTLRFRRSGEPYLEDDGALSLVPAGHGTLARLFPDARAAFPAGHSLLIRNVDNVMGTGAEAMAATTAFLRLHARVLNRLRRIRSTLAKGRLEEAAASAARLLALRGDRPLPAPVAAILADVADPAERTLWEALLALFHTRPPARLDSAALQGLYERPLNILGQVPNTGHDVGGTACFVAGAGAAGADRTGAGPGLPVKVCIEVPHVSDADKAAFLANPAKATHFNPVFVAAEIPRSRDHYDAVNKDFWLLAEKTYRNEPVVYFETVLYELLGNGDMANALFVEVPRLVFNPHKTLKDAANRSVRAWLTP
jgi:hypothetical protein